uniref:MMS19 nucleotide excision repair protein n=1 Tax=Chromera velia CCMP2878 TaxID=1169474 RepID=A0A0G4FCC8_9ALVE|mmetsp:Transcript_29206/g.57281  ORF Transcript_29206/g.57281 Transcript_29206/m.57281 type:complete len:1270 (-) Transcript_29206:242-4051(-)|eukprot:Cvel_16316.t1-p1 / transcript=Cvel_16316.t1 / gene=Cvel_16316 / organism=Chromera_velia_CCMP2878 / gene_product=MMS19 nucleotide excision repair protein homolog, putative / transcript_product=MMS19 nucleotide excision repair protein homolog, putative / location=Cvel_scaffold1252:8916-14228(+) / protein_length=1269 / sequence_SO=supercontig / SO=protein_coding / is_pseudo=false
MEVNGGGIDFQAAIEAYIKPDGLPEEQVSALNGILLCIQGQKASILDLVTDLGAGLTSETPAVRRRSALCIGEVFHRLPELDLSVKQVETIVAFFSSRIADWHSIEGTMKVFLALAKFHRELLAESRDEEGIPVMKAMTVAVNRHVHAPSFAQPIRHLVLEFLTLVVTEWPETAKEIGCKFAGEVCQQAEDEKDPRNLLLSLPLLSRVVKLFEDELQQDAMLHVADILTGYFPIQFRPGAHDPFPFSESDLKRELRDALASSARLHSEVLPWLLDCMRAQSEPSDDNLEDCVETIGKCLTAYGGPVARLHLTEIFTVVSDEIFVPSAKSFQTGIFSRLWEKTLAIAISDVPVGLYPSWFDSVLAPALDDLSIQIVNNKDPCSPAFKSVKHIVLASVRAGVVVVPLILQRIVLPAAKHAAELEADSASSSGTTGASSSPDTKEGAGGAGGFSTKKGEDAETLHKREEATVRFVAEVLEEANVSHRLCSPSALRVHTRSFTAETTDLCLKLLSPIDRGEGPMLHVLQHRINLVKYILKALTCLASLPGTPAPQSKTLCNLLIRLPPFSFNRVALEADSPHLSPLDPAQQEFVTLWQQHLAQHVRLEGHLDGLNPLLDVVYDSLASLLHCHPDSDIPRTVSDLVATALPFEAAERWKAVPMHILSALEVAARPLSAPPPSLGDAAVCGRQSLEANLGLTSTLEQLFESVVHTAFGAPPPADMGVSADETASVETKALLLTAAGIRGLARSFGLFEAIRKALTRNRLESLVARAKEDLAASPPTQVQQQAGGSALPPRLRSIAAVASVVTDVLVGGDMESEGNAVEVWSELAISLMEIVHSSAEGFEKVEECGNATATVVQWGGGLFVLAPLLASAQNLPVRKEGEEEMEVTKLAAGLFGIARKLVRLSGLRQSSPSLASLHRSAQSCASSLLRLLPDDFRLESLRQFQAELDSVDDESIPATSADAAESTRSLIENVGLAAQAVLVRDPFGSGPELLSSLLEKFEKGSLTKRRQIAEIFSVVFAPPRLASRVGIVGRVEEEASSGGASEGSSLRSSSAGGGDGDEVRLPPFVAQRACHMAWAKLESQVRKGDVEACACLAAVVGALPAKMALSEFAAVSVDTMVATLKGCARAVETTRSSTSSSPSGNEQRKEGLDRLSCGSALRALALSCRAFELLNCEPGSLDTLVLERLDSDMTSLVSSLCGLAEKAAVPAVRLLALQTLLEVSKRPFQNLYSHQRGVMRSLARCVDDKKQTVRRLAAICRGAWGCLEA